jgi:hypothetical protein
MNIRKNIWVRLLLPVLILSAGFVAEAAPRPVSVDAGGVNFVIPACGGPLKAVEGKRHQQLFSLNLRVVGKEGISAIMPDWKNTAVEIVEDSAERVVVKTESAMLIKPLSVKEAPKAWNAARFIVEYVFDKKVPGVVMVQRLRAVKPFAYHSWNVPVMKAFKRFSVDGGAFAPYPTTKEFRSKEGGYRTQAGAYVQGETENGDVWWLGREFAAFNPFGDGRPGSFYAAYPSASTEGRNIAAGEELKLSISAGRVLKKGDVEKLRAMRKGGSALPAARFDGDWNKVPVAAWRGETKDYRPVAGLNWNGADDLSFSLKLAWDEKRLYFHANVTDDVVANTFSGKDVALGDSVHAVITDAKGGKVFDKVVSALDARRRPGGYVAEFSVPWKDLRGISREKGIRIGRLTERCHFHRLSVHGKRASEHVIKHYSVFAAQNRVAAGNVWFIDKRVFAPMDQSKTIPEKIFRFAIVDRLSNLPVVMIIETRDLLPVFSYAQNFIQPAVRI